MMQIHNNTHLVCHKSNLSTSYRALQYQHKSALVWFTGLSGAGKSTIAHAVEERLFEMGCKTFVLDGDNVRHGLCSDLGFSELDRMENLRRVGEVAKLFMEAGILVLASFISPIAADRKKLRSTVSDGEFIEVFCNTPLEVCEQRDVKGLYKKARAGEILQFTGITSPYEAPESPEICLRTDTQSVELCTRIVVNELIKRKIISL